MVLMVLTSIEAMHQKLKVHAKTLPRTSQHLFLTLMDITASIFDANGHHSIYF